MSDAHRPVSSRDEDPQVRDDPRLVIIAGGIDARATAAARGAALDALRSVYAEISAGVAATAATPAAPTQPFALPVNPLRGVSFDQALDLVIARLRTVVGDSTPTTDPLGQLAALLGGAP